MRNRCVEKTEELHRGHA